MSHFNNWASFVCLDEVVEPGEIGVCGDEAFDCLWEDVECRALVEGEKPLFTSCQSLAVTEYSYP